MKRLNRSILVVILIASCGGGAFARAELQTVFNLGAAPKGYEVARQIRYGFSIRNEKGTTCDSAEFWVYVPVKKTATQWCQKIESSYPAELIKDELGNQILHFRLSNLAPYSVTLIRIKSDLVLANTPQPFAEQNPDHYLKASEKIQSVSPEIIKTARRFHGRSRYQSAKKIYAWTEEKVKNTGYVLDNRGALYALEQGVGDCTESAELFTALARASGIPSRVCGGYICTTNAKLYPREYHNWSEFMDRTVWRIADPNGQRFDKQQADYIVMHILTESKKENPMGSFSRFRLQGDGLKVRMLD